ncbi:MAG: prepilin-type N-terminal cleavage/methylation domain-containing protein [Acidimicrobiia bacterium]
MISLIRSRLDREEGFTLIELMVVVLIIAILIAIAIPTFLGARNRAQDRAAQSDLRNALTAAKVYYVDNEDYGAAVTDAAFETSMESIEPSLDFAVVGSTSTSVVGFVRATRSSCLLGRAPLGRSSALQTTYPRVAGRLTTQAQR